jgi:hypothetical protein
MGFRLSLELEDCRKDFEELVVATYRFRLAKYSLHELAACREQKP